MNIFENNCLLIHLPYKRQLFPITQVPNVCINDYENKTLMEALARRILSMNAYLWKIKQGNSHLWFIALHIIFIIKCTCTKS